MITTKHHEFLPRQVSLPANPTLGSLAAQSASFFESMTPSTTPTTDEDGNGNGNWNPNRNRNRNRSAHRSKSRSATTDSNTARRKQRRDVSCQSNRSSISILHDNRGDDTPAVHHRGGGTSPWSTSRSPSPKNRTTAKGRKPQTNYKSTTKSKTKPKTKSKSNRSYKSFSESAKSPPTSPLVVLSKTSKASDSNPPRNSGFRANIATGDDPAGRSKRCSRSESLDTYWETNAKGPSELSDEDNCTSSWKSSYRSRRSRRRRRRAKARIHQSPLGNQHATASADGANFPTAATQLRHAESTTATSILFGIIAGGNQTGGHGNEKPTATERSLYGGTPTGPSGIEVTDKDSSALLSLSAPPASFSASSHCSIYGQCYCEKCFDVALHWQTQECTTAIRNRNRHRNSKPQEPSLVRDLFPDGRDTLQRPSQKREGIHNTLPSAPGVPLYRVANPSCKWQGEPRPQVAQAEFGLSPSSTVCVFSILEAIDQRSPQLLGASSTNPDRAGKAWMEDDAHTASSVPSVVGPFETHPTDWLELSYSSDEDWGEEDWEDEAHVDDKHVDAGLVKSWSKDWLKLSSGCDTETTSR